MFGFTYNLKEGAGNFKFIYCS